jgi:hypothetical protein
VHAVHEHVIAEPDVLERRGHSQPGKAVQQRGVGDLQLEPRQRLAEALVDAEAECQDMYRSGE